MARPALDLRAVLLHHLDHTFLKEAWQPSLALALEGVGREEARWKPGPGRHSIWQIVRHVMLWKRATLDAWSGARPLYVAGQGGTAHAAELEGADWAEADGDGEAWQADVRLLHEVSDEIRRRVEALSPAAVLDPFPGEEMPAVLRLLRMATHDIYHAGQIRYLRALYGESAGRAR
jgi:hypothetical protein